jgi:hypothetical protein
MVDTKTNIAGRSGTRGNDPVNENPRNATRKRRLQVLKDARGDRSSIRVVPRDDKIRAVLKHQPSGIAFRKEGGAAWPNDRFTQRRLRDGSVKLEPKQEQEDKSQKKPQEKPQQSA